MFDLPEHLQIGVNARGQGPVCEGEPEFDHYECWCGQPGCTLYREAHPAARHE